VHLVLALVSAACYGAADFVGGLTSRRADTVAVVVLSQFTGLVLLVIMLPFVPFSTFSRADLIWGVAAGVTGSVGVALLYYALAVGTMAVVAPVTAVCAVAIPVSAAIIMGERPAAVAYIGIAMAVLAVVLLSRSHPADDVYDRRRSGVGLAFGAGVAIGFFFLSLARTGPDAGLWPLVVARLVSVPFFGFVGLVGHRPLGMQPRVALAAITAGALDMLANLLYLIATHLGPLSIVVTLSSLYPASTVVLARVTLGERLTEAQQIGVVCALAAVVLIVGGTS